MKKSELSKGYIEDFNASKGALNEVLEHNRKIDNLLVEDLLEGDFKKLEEHLEITKLILDATKNFNELYKNAPSVVSAIEGLQDDTPKKSSSLKDIMEDID